MILQKADLCERGFILISSSIISHLFPILALLFSLSLFFFFWGLVMGLQLKEKKKLNNIQTSSTRASIKALYYCPTTAKAATSNANNKASLSAPSLWGICQLISWMIDMLDIHLNRRGQWTNLVEKVVKSQRDDLFPWTSDSVWRIALHNQLDFSEY